MVLFAGGLSLLVGFLIGILPAWRASRPDLSAGLQEAGRASTGGLRHHRLRQVLVVAQVALAMVLLVNAGLLLRSLQRLGSTEVGFRTADLGVDRFDFIMQSSLLFDCRRTFDVDAPRREAPGARA